MVNVPTRRMRAKMAVKKIRPQFPEARVTFLMRAIVEQAIIDLGLDPKLGQENRTAIVAAKRYLRGEIIHAEICGVDSGWIRIVLRRVGLNLFN